jgi:hypothetical protein
MISPEVRSLDAVVPEVPAAGGADAVDVVVGGGTTTGLETIEIEKKSLRTKFRYLKVNRVF